MPNDIINRTFPLVKPGTIVRVHQEILETNSKGEEKKRIQIFEGTVILRKHGKGDKATITVRKVSDGVGVEKIFPLQMPALKDIEVVKSLRVKRAKLNYLRGKHKKVKDAIVHETHAKAEEAKSEEQPQA